MKCGSQMRRETKARSRRRANSGGFSLIEMVIVVAISLILVGLAIPRAVEAVRGAFREGILGRAVAYDNYQKEIPSSLIRSLRWHPVRLMSFMESAYYYGAKKQYLDWVYGTTDRAFCLSFTQALYYAH